MKLKFDATFLKAPDSKYLIALLPRFREKRIQRFTTLALTLITFSVFAIFAIAPTLGTITDLQKQISDSQFVSDQLQKKITVLSQLQDSYQHIKPELPAVFDAVPTDASIAIFLGQIQTIANNSNVSVDRIQTLPIEFNLSTSTVQYSSYAFAVDVDGTAENTQLFLKNLTSFSRLVAISAISYGKTTRLASTYLLSVRGMTYFQGQ